MVIFRKSWKTKLFRKPTEVSQNTPRFTSKNGPLKKWKFRFFWRLFLQNKNCWHFEFLMNQISGQRFNIFEKWRYRSQLLLKLRAVEVATLFHWILSRPTYNNKHTKTAVNSTIQFSESRYQKKYLVKLWSFLTHIPQYEGPVKFLRNWTETIL